MKTIPTNLLTKVNLDALYDVYQGQVMLSLLPADAQVLWDILQAVGLSHVPEIYTGCIVFKNDEDNYEYVSYEDIQQRTCEIAIKRGTNLHRWLVVEILSNTFELHDSEAAKQWVVSTAASAHTITPESYYSVSAINHPVTTIAGAIIVARNCAVFSQSDLAAKGAAFRCRVLVALADYLPGPTDWRYPE